MEPVQKYFDFMNFCKYVDYQKQISFSDYKNHYSQPNGSHLFVCLFLYFLFLLAILEKGNQLRVTHFLLTTTNMKHPPWGNAMVLIIYWLFPLLVKIDATTFLVNMTNYF